MNIPGFKIYMLFSLLIFLFNAPMAPAQLAERRPIAKPIKVKRTINRKALRNANRRVVRRTLRTLPPDTRGIAFRRITYYPVGGMYFVSRSGVYQRAFPPLGFRIRTLPGAFLRLVVGGLTFAYADGVFYKEAGEEYEVVAPPLGAVIPKAPEDALKIDVDGNFVYALNNVVYIPVKDGLQVSEIIED